MSLISKFILRIPLVIHTRLKLLASENNLSLNSLCQKLLEEGIRKKTSFGVSAEGEFEILVQQARKIFEEDLLGIVAFGSYIRSQASESSDIDLLIILKPNRKIEKALYTEWYRLSEQTKIQSSFPISVHFVVLPDDTFKCSNLWLEIGLEGIIIWDPTWTVNRFLIKVRKFISDGLVSFRLSHGQRYWIWSKEAA